MALYSKKDFANLCGIKTNQLSVVISRGNIILTGDLIDETNAKNSAFLQKQREKQLKISESPIPKESKKENITESAPVPPVQKFKKKKNDLSIYSLDQEIKIADLQKKEVDTRIALLKEEKLIGASIPTDLVKSVISNLSKSMISSFKDGADQFIIEISKRKNLTVVESAELKGKIVEIINMCSSKAISESRKNLKNIIIEFSNKKEVGEHE